MIAFKARAYVLFRPKLLMDFVSLCCCPCTLFCSILQACHFPFRFIGVTRSSLRNRWAVNLALPTEQAGHSTCVFLGCFDSDEEAARVADKGRVIHVRLQMFEMHMQHCVVSDIYKIDSTKGAENITEIVV